MDAVGINTSDQVETVAGMISTVDVCRVCLLGNLAMRELFLETEVASLSAKAMSFANVKMIPGDGLPARVCYICADKLESAYEFKLQVEQADTVLRERYMTMSIKEELFFNEVEVHLEPDRNEGIGVLHAETHYEGMPPLDTASSDDKAVLKDQLTLLQVEKLAGETDKEQDETGAQEYSETVAEEAERIEREEETMAGMAEPELRLKCPPGSDAIPADEHDYILQQECVMPEHTTNQDYTAEESYQDQAELQESEATDPQEYGEAVELVEEQTMVQEEEEMVVEQEHQEEQEVPLERTEETVEQDFPQNETRRSKRKLSRRTLNADRDSDEENYFENLNLSSRLKKVQADKSEKVFFLCYLCDKQFVSKDILKEHMHSHEEVRRTLLLKRSPEKTPKNSTTSPSKMPPSGKRANKCPYCGKEYLYIISFCKHLKQHEREKDSTMPLEVSFHEDEHSLNLDSDPEYRRRRRRVEAGQVNDDEEAEPLEEEEGRRRFHRGSDMFSCDRCQETFSTKRALQKHSITHIDLKCNVCEEEFDTLEKLRNHRTKHVMEGVLGEQDLEEDAKRTMKKETETYVTEGDRGEENQERFEEQFVEDQDEKSGPETPSTRSYSCKFCWQRFPRKEQLQRHTEQEHARVKSFVCTQCNKTFGNELTLRNHLIATNHKTFMHGEEYDPNKRIKRVAAKAAQKIIDKIKTEDGLEDYEDDDDDDDDDEEKKRGECEGTTYARKRESQKRYRKDQLECATCNRKCGSKQSLAKHMEQHAKDEKAVKAEKPERSRKSEKKESVKSEPPDTNETVATTNTGGVVGLAIDDDDDDDDNSDFESGLDWPMDSHECTTCKKRYSTKKSLLRHQLLHEEPNFECDICNVKFYRKDKLKAHYDKCSEKNPDQVRKCNICGDSFENNEILKEHRSKHVTEGILTEEDLRDIEPRPEERKSGEKIGRKRRTDIVGLECTECNKQYTSRKGLLRHIQVHEGKKYLCDICPKKFYRREHLKIHVAKHNMIKPYKCTRCTKRFIKEEQLTSHLSKHDRTFKKSKETDSSKRFLCEICSKSFTQSTTLIAHLRAHNGIKPYVCEVCSRPFTTNAYLKMHMRTHTQERPYICQYCSRAFARADTLANHLTSHTGEAKYHCKYCPKNFRRLKSLKEHVFIHTGQRPYACPTCDRRFNNNGSRYAHSKRCKQNFVQNQNRAQAMAQVQPQAQNTTTAQRITHQTIAQGQIVKAQNIKTITIARQPTLTTDGQATVTTQQVMQHQEILMPLILPLTVTLTDVGEEVILPEGTKIFTTS